MVVKTNSQQGRLAFVIKSQLFEIDCFCFFMIKEMKL